MVTSVTGQRLLFIDKIEVNMEHRREEKNVVLCISESKNRRKEEKRKKKAQTQAEKRITGIPEGT